MTIEELMKNLDSVIDKTINSGEKVVVKTHSGNAVILSEEEYESMKETIYVLSQPGLASRIKEGEKEDISKMHTFFENEDF